MIQTQLKRQLFLTTIISATLVGTLALTGCGAAKKAVKETTEATAEVTADTVKKTGETIEHTGESAEKMVKNTVESVADGGAVVNEMTKTENSNQTDDTDRPIEETVEADQQY